MASVWMDVINPSDVHFFSPIYSLLKAKHEIQLTARQRAETVDLVRIKEMKARPLGRDAPGKISRPALLAWRTIQAASVRHFCVAIGFENPSVPMVARLRGRPSVQFLDNDLKFDKTNVIQNLETRARLGADVLIVPEVFDTAALKRIGKKSQQVLTYPGFKEDLYLGQFQRDPFFPKSLPFSDYVVVRPEALGSFYVDHKTTIVPDLLRRLRRRGLNVIFLPRDPGDSKLAEGIDAFVPGKSLDGLNLVWHARCVMTGSGTLAREAARLGVPSVSFFPDQLLSVDRVLVERGEMVHSRDVDEIVGIAERGPTKTPSNQQSVRVSETILSSTLNVVDRLSKQCRAHGG